MKRHIVSLAAAAFLAAISTAAWAQPTQDGGSRPAGSGGGTNSGSAASAGGGGGGGTVSSGGGGGGGGSNISTSSASTGGGGNAIGWDRPGLDFPRASAPMRGPGAAAFSEGQRAVPRGGGGGGGGASGEGSRSRPAGGGGGGEGQRAVPRGGDMGDRGDRGVGRGATTLTMDAGGREPANSPQRAAVPTYSRPRDGRVPVGTPVDRSTAPGGPWYPAYPSYPYYPYYPYYPGYGYGYYSGFGFGLGYFYDPFAYGYGYGGYPYYSSGGGYYSSRGYDTGGLRLKIQPRDAKVYVDGYFVGVVDSFDGMFQKLAVEAGTHRVEVRADGYEPAQFEIMVTPGETITYKGQLKRITP